MGGHVIRGIGLVVVLWCPSLQVLRAETLVERFTARLTLDPHFLSARQISVADSYCNAFYFDLLFLRSFACTFVGSRVVSFVSLFLRSFILSLFRSCLHWFDFFVLGCRFGAFALCDVCRCYLLVTTLRVHPAVTRLTVYRRF